MIRALTFICVSLGFALIALLLRASGNNAFFSDNYTLLYWIGLALTIGLIALISWQVATLWKKLKAQVFGAKLALRLMVVFAFMAIIPGGLVYAISVQFLNRSIDSWFDVPVERALQGALDLGKTALESGLSDFAVRARDAAMRAADMRGDAVNIAQAVRARSGFDEVSLMSETGQVIASAGKNERLPRVFADLPAAKEVRLAIERAPQKSIESAENGNLYYRVVILIPVAPNVVGARVMQVLQEIPKKVSSDAASVEEGFRDYQQLGAQRSGLKRLFALTLTLAMMLTLFSAVLLSFLLSDRLSAPLSALAESTHAIARGDFTKINPVTSRDEFGVLTQSFNTMTRQLADTSAVVALKQTELEHANAYLESILGNLTSGVITLDAQLRVQSINRNAEEMIGAERGALRHQSLPEWMRANPALTTLADEVVAQINKAAEARTKSRSETAASGTAKPWESHAVIDWSERADASNPTATSRQNLSRMGKRTLQVRGVTLPDLENSVVLVLDDITRLIQAQRDAAWGEVARRLAHEIKNPLTPIQLSAERLQMKLADKLPEVERAMLERATHTIVAQVGALKGMVDDFSLYSRSSRLKPGPVDVNDLIEDVLALYESMHAKVVRQLTEGLPIISGDPALLRQVIHNLMQNALDATQGLPDALIVVSTRRYSDEHGDVVEMCVADNGTGIRKDVRDRIFEPYVTTKAKGTGLGLAIVKKIIDEHGGRIEMRDGASDETHSSEGAGVSVHLYLPILKSAAENDRSTPHQAEVQHEPAEPTEPTIGSHHGS